MESNAATLAKSRPHRGLRSEQVYAILLDRKGIRIVRQPAEPPNLDRATLAARLKELRKLRRLSQDQLAEISLIPQGSISNWETGKTEPDATKLPALARALQVSIASLLCQEIEPEQAPLPATDRQKLLSLARQMRQILKPRRVGARGG